MVKEQKGMSLLSLLITIVVLLILGAITIAILVAGDVFPSQEDTEKQETQESARGDINNAIQIAVQEVKELYYTQSENEEEVPTRTAKGLAELFVKLINESEVGATASIPETVLDEDPSVIVTIKDETAKVERTVTIDTAEGSDLVTVGDWPVK